LHQFGDETNTLLSILSLISGVNRPRPEVGFKTAVLSTLEGLFAAGAEVDGKLIHKLRLSSACSSASKAAGSIGELSDRSCRKKSAISGVLGFCNAGILWSGRDRETAILLLF